MFTQMNIRPSSYCNRIAKSLSPKTFDRFDGEKLICGTGRQQKNSSLRDGSCSGDSGGPLVAKVLNEKNEEKFTLIGIVSFGGGHYAGCGSFGAYTKVSKYLNFIRDPKHDLVGETVTTIPQVKFTLHDGDGEIVRDEMSIRDNTEIPSFGKLAPHILFGWTAQPKLIPWQIQFLNPNFPEYQCGGTLITPNKIVSAAHCFYEEWLSDEWREEDLVIKAGNIERLGRSDFVQKRKCSQIIVHS